MFLFNSAMLLISSFIYNLIYAYLQIYNNKCFLNKLCANKLSSCLPAQQLWQTGDDGSVPGSVVIQLKQWCRHQFIVFRNGKQSCKKYQSETSKQGETLSLHIQLFSCLTFTVQVCTNLFPAAEPGTAFYALQVW